MQTKSPDVIILTEHGLSEAELQITNVTGYTLISNFSRQQHKLGGVAILTKQCYVKTTTSIVITEGCEEMKLEAAVIKLSTPSGVLHVLGLYRQPKANLTEALDKLLNIIELTKIHKRPLILMGDINVDCLKHDNDTAKVNEMLAMLDMERLNLPPTRVTATSSTSIDCVCTNLNSLDLEVEVIHTGISDHRAQVCKLQLQVLKTVEPTLTTRNFHKDNLQHLKIILSETDWLRVYCATTAEEAYNEFLKKVVTSMDVACPKKKRRPRSKKNKTLFDDSEVRRLKLEYLQALTRFDLTGANEDKINCANIKRVYDLRLKALRKIASSSIINNAENKPKAIWSIINKERNKQNKPNPEIKLKINGKIITNPVAVAEQLNNHFAEAAEKALAARGTQRVAPNPNITTTCNIHLNELDPTTPEEVLKIINTFKPKLSAGLDEIPPNILKHCSKELTLPLTSIINKSFKEGFFPSALKLSNVYPKHKKGLTNDPSNYRPITLVSTFSKVIEKTVLVRLLNHLTENNLLTDKQHGFVRGKSTTTALVSLIEEIINQLEEGKFVSGILLDYSKAFDSLGHDLIISKLKAMGVSGKAIDWFQSYLMGRSQVVEVKYEENRMVHTVKSTPKAVTRGVPQGSVLGPVLFILFTNDLPLHLDNMCSCLMYADDTTLVVNDKTIEGLEMSSRLSLDKAYQYCSENDLVANMSKTKQILFRNRFNLTELANIALEQKVKLLGITIDADLTWTPHVDQLCKKLSTGLFALKRVKNIADNNTARTAYFGLCEAHIRYGLPAWGGTSKMNMERVLILQKRAIRILANLQQVETCRNAFKELRIMTVVSLYIRDVIMYVDEKNLQRNSNIHKYHTRHASQFVTPRHRLTLFEKKPEYIGCKLHNHLPEHLRILRGKTLKNNLTKWLIDRPIYTLDEFYQQN